MRLKTAKQLLLVLGFLLGQSFALAHSIEHEILSATTADSCAICAVAHSPNAAAPEISISLGELPKNERVALQAPPAIVVHLVVVPPSQGPPLHLV